MQIVHRTAFAVIAAAVTAGAFAPAAMAETAPIASNQRSAPIQAKGYEPGSVVYRGPCKGWMNTKKIKGRWYAQGLVYSSSAACWMKLERKHNGGSYEMISDYYYVHDGTQANTGWHYDHRGYKARVCIQLSTDSSWHCGKGI
ncbi:hypothetical protein [Actinomadura formosensis]|uniref:hypothetical protein n=1 Tax=Actinomadura formosensis TaxID=60706 RepID=UPI000834BA84|nr:hypothetical protein [Actinomadura formosensis]